MAAPQNQPSNTSNLTPPTIASTVTSLGRCFIRGGPTVEFQTSYRFYTKVVSLPLVIVLMVICLVANATIITSVLRKISQTQPRLLITLSLALSDFLWGAIQSNTIWSSTSTVILSGGCASRSPLSPAYHVIYHVCFASSIGSLLVMSMDCYLCVRRPLAYRYIVTRCRAISITASVWLLTAVYVTWYAYATREVKAGLNSSFGGVIAVLIVLFQVAIFVEHRRHNIAMVGNLEHPNAALAARNRANERKIAIATVYLLVTLILGYVPRMFNPLISAIVGYNAAHMMATFNVLALLGCATARPFVAYRKNAQIKASVRKLLRRSNSIIALPSARNTGPGASSLHGENSTEQSSL